MTSSKGVLVTAELIELIARTAGPAGLVLLGCGWFIYRQAAQLADVQERRIQDARLAMERVIQLVDKQHEHASLLTQAIDGNADAIGELRRVVASLSDNVGAKGESVVEDTARFSQRPRAPRKGGRYDRE